jgi:hypothetical protein
MDGRREADILVLLISLTEPGKNCRKFYTTKAGLILTGVRDGFRACYSVAPQSHRFMVGSAVDNDHNGNSV